MVYMIAMSEKRWVKPDLEAIRLEQTKSGAGSNQENKPGQGSKNKSADAAQSPT